MHTTYIFIMLVDQSFGDARYGCVYMYILLSAICWCTFLTTQLTTHFFLPASTRKQKQEMHTLLKKHKRKDSIKKIASENLDATKCILQVEIVTSEPWIVQNHISHPHPPKKRHNIPQKTNFTQLFRPPKNDWCKRFH